MYRLLKNLDRRWIFLSMLLAVSIPILARLVFPEVVSKQAKLVFDAIDDLPDGSNILLEETNTVITDRDNTQHAELRAISRACRELDYEKRKKTTIYASTEPCAMCCGALYWSGIRHVVFGLRSSKLEELMGLSE